MWIDPIHFREPCLEFDTLLCVEFPKAIVMGITARHAEAMSNTGDNRRIVFFA